MNLAIVKFCAEEVDRQGRGAIQVWNMVEAWHYAVTQPSIVSRLRSQSGVLDMIERCGVLVEPSKNDGGWRQCGVRVGNHVAPDAQLVPRLMRNLISRCEDLTPAELYLEFETIHPFRDGNGRVGKILFNWANKTLDAPVMPPDFFGCTNY